MEMSFSLSILSEICAQYMFMYVCVSVYICGFTYNHHWISLYINKPQVLYLYLYCRILPSVFSWPVRMFKLINKISKDLSTHKMMLHAWDRKLLFLQGMQNVKEKESSDFFFFVGIPEFKPVACRWLMADMKARRILFCGVFWWMDVNQCQWQPLLRGTTAPPQAPSCHEYCCSVHMSAQLMRHIIFLSPSSPYPAAKRNVSFWFNWAGTRLFPRILLKAPNFESQANSQDCSHPSLEWSPFNSHLSTASSHNQNQSSIQ